MLGWAPLALSALCVSSGDGLPSAIAAGAPGEAVFVDFDRDGDLDVAVCGVSGACWLLRSEVAGEFLDVTERCGLAALRAPHGASWFDVDADGDADLLALGEAGVALYRNLNGAWFEDATQALGLSGLGPIRRASYAAGDAGSPPELILETDAGTIRARLDGGRFVPQPEREAAGGDRGDDKALGGPAHGGPTLGPPATKAPAGPATAAAQLAQVGCVQSLDDQASSGCLKASSAPLLGFLYPLSEDLFVDAGGRVGIGTTALDPSTRLQVHGLQVLVSEDHGAGQTAAFIQGDFNGTGRVAVGATSIGEPRGPLTFITADAERLTIDTEGRVGIGTTVPTAQLTVASASHPRVKVSSSGPAFNPGIQFDRAGADAWEMGVDDGFGAGGLYWYGGSSANYRMGIAANGDVLLAPYGGRVGVGTATPGQQLSVAGTIESLSGGFKFPDGSIQTSAAAGPANAITSINGAAGPGIAIQGSGAISVSTSGNTLTISTNVSVCTYGAKTYTTGASCFLANPFCCSGGGSCGFGECPVIQFPPGSFQQQCKFTQLTCQANGSFSSSHSLCTNALPPVPVCGL